jgi:4-hydroxy-3-methylbut-2-enyl diphosphate reductase
LQKRKTSQYIKGEKDAKDLKKSFRPLFSEDSINQFMQKIGVVNRPRSWRRNTSHRNYLKQVMVSHYGLNADNLSERFADTGIHCVMPQMNNQTAVTGLLETRADLAVVVGGYNARIRHIWRNFARPSFRRFL